MRISDWSSDVCSSDLRVYPPKSSAPVSGVPSETVRNTGGDTGNTSDSNVLQARLNAALEQLRDRDCTIDDLRHRLDRSDEERREAQARVIGLLAGPGPTESKRGFFGRLFGRPDEGPPLSTGKPRDRGLIHVEQRRDKN